MKRTIMAMALVLFFGILGGCVVYLPYEQAEDTSVRQAPRASVNPVAVPVNCRGGFHCWPGHYDREGRYVAGYYCQRCEQGENQTTMVQLPPPEDSGEVYNACFRNGAVYYQVKPCTKND